MKNISSNIIALGLFLDIISIYGVFKEKKDFIKKLKNSTQQKEIIKMIKNHESDSDFYALIPEGGVLGLGEDASLDIQNLVISSFFSIENNEIQELISFEKKYKKLKISFCEQFPELKDEMLDTLKLHKERTANKKKSILLNKDAIESLSPQFISFANYTFGIGDCNHMAYNSFSRKIIEKYEISINESQRDITFLKIEKNHKKLNIIDIKFLGGILEEIVGKVSDDDLNNFSLFVSKEKNRHVATSIVKSNFYRFSKLLDTYKKLINLEKNI